MSGILEQDRSKIYLPSEIYEFDFGCRDISIEEAAGINTIELKMKKSIFAEKCRSWSKGLMR